MCVIDVFYRNIDPDAAIRLDPVPSSAAFQPVVPALFAILPVAVSAIARKPVVTAWFSPPLDGTSRIAVIAPRAH